MNEFEREMWRWGLTCALAALMSYSPEVPAGLPETQAAISFQHMQARPMA